MGLFKNTTSATSSPKLYAYPNFLLVNLLNCLFFGRKSWQPYKSKSPSATNISKLKKKKNFEHRLKWISYKHMKYLYRHFSSLHSAVHPWWLSPKVQINNGLIWKQRNDYGGTFNPSLTCQQAAWATAFKRGFEVAIFSDSWLITQ